MYRCSICQAVAQPREPQRKWAVTRQLNNFRTVAGELTNFPIVQVERELVVCKDCHGQLVQGKPLTLVIGQRGRPVPVPPPPKAPPRPEEVRSRRPEFSAATSLAAETMVPLPNALPAPVMVLANEATPSEELFPERKVPKQKPVRGKVPVKKVSLTAKKRKRSK